MRIFAAVQCGIEKTQCEDSVIIGDTIVSDGALELAIAGNGAICIADGVGGNAGGHIASAYATEQLKSFLELSDDIDEKSIRRRLIDINGSLLKKGNDVGSPPGTGLSYVDETGKNKNRASNFPTPQNNALPAPQPRNDITPQGMTRNIDSADISSFKDAGIGNITAAIERTIKLNKISTFLIIFGILAFGYPLLFVLPILGIILKVVAHKSGSVHLEYTLDSEKADEYERRIGAWQILAEGDREWQIIQESDVINRKTSAGAGRNVNRVVCHIEKKTPFYIKSNIAAIQIKLQKEVLIFLPDKVFIIRKSKVGLVNYEDVNIRTSHTNFIEHAAVPKDAVVVGSTWQYVNKNGTPDKRYNNNRQLPICQYGVVYLTSSSCLNVEMQVSNVKKSRDFEELIR